MSNIMLPFDIVYSEDECANLDACHGYAVERSHINELGERIWNIPIMCKRHGTFGNKLEVNDESI